MTTRSGRIRSSLMDASPPRKRKGVSPPRSPASPRKTSPPTRTSLRKSPSRKSPSRKPAESKYPARKSPSRTTKEATVTAAQKSPGKRQTESLTVNLQDITKLDIYRGTRSARRAEYSIKDLSTGLSQNNEIDEQEIVNGVNSSESNNIYGLRKRKSFEERIPRRSGRRRDFVDVLSDKRRSLSKSSNKSVSKSISQSITISDEEDSEDEVRNKKSESVTRKLATPLRDSVSKLAQISSRWEFGGRIGSVLMMILIPLAIFSILLSCSKSCSLKNLYDLSMLKSLSIWFSSQALAIVSVQFLLQALLSYVPVLGTKADRQDETGTKQYFNAFFCSIVTLNVIFALNFLNLYDSNKVLSEYWQLATVSYIFAVILSIILYVKSGKMDDSELNPYGNTGYLLYDFCMGREIHPFIKNFDVKIWISRIDNISSLILAVLIFKHGIHLPANATNLTLENYKEYLSKVQFKPTILLYAMMQIVYILNFIMKEYKITTTFFWQSEGLGYFQLVSSALYPFYFTTISKFVADTNLVLSTNALIAASVLYCLGFLFMLISNNIKYEFRKNPFQPTLQHLDWMPTFHGKKLLVANLWGILRHPNYTGDILIHIALALPGILSKQYVAAAPALLTILLLLHRAWRDHARCRRRYGAAWDRYCKRVSSVIVPKVL